MIRFIGLICLLLATATAVASDYTLGNDGYYYNSAGNAFVRSQYYQAACNGRCGYYYFTYSPYQAPYQAPVAAVAATVTPAAVYPAADWRNKLIDLATARDAAILKERAGALEHQYYLDAVSALGLKGNFTIQAYGQAVNYGTNFSAGVPYSQSAGVPYSQAAYFAPQASTLYGYTYNDLTKIYGDTDLMQLYQTAGRLTENAQKFGGVANDNFAALVDKAADQRARHLEILAKAQAFSQAMKSLEEKKVIIESKGSGFGPAPQPLPVNPVQPVAPVAPPLEQADRGLEQLGNVMAAKCAACHSTETKKGGLDLSQWLDFSKEKKRSVWARLVTPDQDKMMPRTKDGGPGVRLPPEEVQLFLAN